MNGVGSRGDRLMINYDAKNFKPDFYFLTSHGTGMWSSWYLLKCLGFPVSINLPIPMPLNNGRLTDIRFPGGQADDVLMRGLTIDHCNTQSALSYGDIKTIQTVRDPIDAMTSYLNAGIGNGVYNNDINLGAFNLKTYLDFLWKESFYVVRYTSLRKCANTHAKALMIDCSDLNTQRCKTTFAKVVHYLSEKTESEILVPDEIFKIRYNSLENRIWRYQNGIYLMGINKEYIGPFHIFPSFLHDYYAYYNKKIIIDQFVYNNISYIISIQESTNEILSTMKKFDSSLYRKNFENAIDIFLSFKEISDNLYKKYSFTPEKTIDLIRSNPTMRSRFLKLLDYEMSVCIKEIPEKVENWKNYHSL